MSGDLVQINMVAELRRRKVNFFRLLRITETGPVPVYQSESAVIVQKTARWRPVRVGAAGLMRDNPEQPLAMEMYEYRSNGAHILVDTHKFTFSELAAKPGWEGSFGTESHETR